MTERAKVLPLRKKPRNRFPNGGVIGRTPTQAAKELGISWRLLRRAIASGDVQVTSFGGATYISHAEIARLRKLFEQQEEQP
jgi:predicted secreted hydrolase